MSTKTCSKCKMAKPVEEFYTTKYTKDGRVCYCKLCKRAIGRRYYLANKDKFAEWNRALKVKNADKIMRQNKEWRERNPGHSTTWYRANKDRLSRECSQRRKCDPAYRLARVCRLRMWHALRGTNKSASTMALLGCTTEQLRIHLEHQFKPGMSWSNYGYGADKWNIDHRIPCASFDLTDPEQQRKCFHFTNLQPMWQLENFAKGARLLEPPEPVIQTPLCLHQLQTGTSERHQA